ncbi:MAG: hypothetical protein ACJATT_004328 [Myxococcota bacterium]|jgi:hypothetical protein
MQDLVDVHYPDADRIRVVQDNLNTHKPESLYVTFPPEEARRIVRKLEFHYTPKHASGLNMVEIEIGVMSQQRLNRRINDIERLTQELAAWEPARNDAGASINWMFDVDKVRMKIGNAYSQVGAPAIPDERTNADRALPEVEGRFLAKNPAPLETDNSAHQVSPSASTLPESLRGRAKKHWARYSASLGLRCPERPSWGRPNEWVRIHAMRD